MLQTQDSRIQNLEFKTAKGKVSTWRIWDELENLYELVDELG